jgi:cob(I)alamin adenosyltransferase
MIIISNEFLFSEKLFFTNTFNMIHIYTGTGKGKTSSAVGLCARALGHGLKVCYSSFHKNTDKYGYNEINCLRKHGAEVLNFAKGHPNLDSSIDRKINAFEAKEGVKLLRE